MTDGPGSPSDPPPPGGPGGWSDPPGAYPPSYPPLRGYGYPPQPPRPGIIPLRPLRLGEILDGTLRMIRANPTVTLGLSAVVGALTGLPVAVTDAMYFRELGGAPSLGDRTGPNGEPVSSSAVAAGSVSSALSVVLAFVATTILVGLLTRVLGRAVFGRRITIGEAWRTTRSRVWALLGLSLLVALAIGLPVMLVVLAGVGAAFGSTALIVLAALLGVAWLVYAVFVGTRLVLAPAVLVLERLGAAEAMVRSWRLVRGDTWRVLGIILVTQLLVAVVGGLAAAPFTIGGRALSGVGERSVALVASVALLLTVGQTIGAMLTYPFTAGVYGLLYADRRMRTEAFELQLQRAAVGPGQVPVDDVWRPPTPSAVQWRAGGAGHGFPPPG